MDSADIGDFLQDYRVISSKIKKRLLRKPKIAEASEDFSKLCAKQKEYESWPQAGMCCMAIAKCEQSLANPVTEVAAVIEAARNFLKEHRANYDLQCPSYGEHLVTSISFYQQALKILTDQNRELAAASLGMEIGTALCAMNCSSEGLTFLKDSSSRLQGSPLEHLICLEKIASANIDLGNLEGSLKVFTQIMEIASELDENGACIVAKDYLARSEICSVLLLLTLRQLPSQLSSEHAKLIEKYSWSDNYSNSPDVPYNDPELTVLLQSLVIQSRDLESLGNVERHLTQRLSGQALQLLFILVTEMNRDS